MTLREATTSPKQSATRTAILVLGMHRSGTSAIARMLNLCGANLGEALLPPKADNERGFWENSAILALHERFLEQMGFQWHRVVTPASDWQGAALARQFVADLAEILESQFASSDLFLVKDPRLSLLAPLWLEALSSAGVRPVFVITIRHPDEVAASLEQRDGFSPAQSRLLWLQHTIEAERWTRGYPRVFVHYEHLLQDWRTQLTRIGSQLGVRWRVSARVRETEIAQFIAPSLRHQRADESAEPLPEIVERVYRRASKACQQTAPANAAFGSATEDFDTAMQIVAPLQRVWSERSAQARVRHEQEIAQARSVIADKDRELELARSTIDTFAEEVRQARQAHLTRDAVETDLRTELQDAKAKTQALTTAVAIARQEQEARKREFHDATRKHEALATERGQLARGLEQMQRQIVELHQQRSANQFAIENLEQQIVQARQAHRARDITERILHEHIQALCHSRWFRLGRRLRILPSPQSFPLTEPTADEVAPPAPSSATLRANLDTPLLLEVEAGRVRFSGWCAHPALRIMDLLIAVGQTRSACQYRLERADVGEAFPDIPGSAHSGFEANIEIAPGAWPIEFVAILEDGSEVTHEWQEELHVRAQPLLRRLTRWARSNVGMLGYGIKEGKRWVADNRRLPRLREIPHLLRLAREQHRWQTDVVADVCPPGYRVPEKQDAYAVWQEFNVFNAPAREDLERRLSAVSDLPLLSVVMPVYNPPLDLLRAAVNSVREQVYPAWELCIADDASSDAGVLAYLADLQQRDARVHLCQREKNGNISAATNSAAKLARGEFIVLLDADDLLTPDALGEIALCAAAQSTADILYSDDDKIDVDGHRFAPQFKPDWSPELLLGYMYFSHVFAVRRSLYERVGGMRVGFEGSQDYDFALRVSELARAIAHIPQVLYHWRVLPGSTAASGAAKPESFEAGRRAVAEALARRGIRAEAFQPAWAAKIHCAIFDLRFPDDGPKVSILIPTRNEFEVLRQCIDSLRKTTYRNYEVLVIDNESDDPASLRYFESCGHRVERISNPNHRFNYAHINNRAAELTDSELLLFLNNDTEIVEPRWLSQMVGYAQFAGVGAVGARLLYPDKRIQHAGIVHGYYHGMAGPAFKLVPAWDNGYLSYARVTRNYSAVTAACMLTSRKLFLELGGFDEVRFEVAYNDVDYCYRLGERGLRSVYCADAELLHHEGHSRGFFDRPQEIAEFRRLYGCKRDTFYSPHLSLDHERFAIKPRRFAPRPIPPVRALMCAFNLNWEGAPYSQLELTLGLKRNGFIEPVVYAPQDGPLRAAYEKAGIVVHVFDHPIAGVLDETAYDRALDNFGEFIRRIGVELVYGNTLQTFYAIDAAHRIGLPTLWNPRESEPWQTYFNFLPPPLAARALRCFEYPYRVIFVADATRRVWEPLDSRNNFSVIHNGLDLGRLYSEAERYPRVQARLNLDINPDEIAVLLPGTVCERKGQQDLLRAIAQLPPASTARLRCFIVGDRAGMYSLELRKLADALPPDLRQRVRIVPETHEIARYYQAADIFVCTSRVESFPRVVLEAMFFSLPVISTRVFGVVEQVSENVNALLYEPGDTPQLASHLRRLIDDDAVRARLAKNSQPMLATLNTFDEMVAAYGNIFREAALTSLRQSSDPETASHERNAAL